MKFVIPKDANASVCRASNGQFYLIEEETGVYLVHTATGQRILILQAETKSAPSDGKAGDPEIDRFSRIQTLSLRETQVIRMLGEGKEMSEIATAIGISVKTIETYRARIKQKLEIKGRGGLIKFAVEWTLAGRPFDRIQMRRSRSLLADGDGHTQGKPDFPFRGDGSK